MPRRGRSTEQIYKSKAVSAPGQPAPQLPVFNAVEVDEQGRLLAPAGEGDIRAYFLSNPPPTARPAPAAAVPTTVAQTPQGPEISYPKGVYLDDVRRQLSMLDAASPQVERVQPAPPPATPYGPELSRIFGTTDPRELAAVARALGLNPAPAAPAPGAPRPVEPRGGGTRIPPMK